MLALDGILVLLESIKRPVDLSATDSQTHAVSRDGAKSGIVVVRYLSYIYILIMVGDCVYPSQSGPWIPTRMTILA